MTHPFTIIIPHFRNGKITAFTINQILKHSQGREVEIVVVDNSQGAGTEYLQPFMDKIKLVAYPAGKVQSHGVAYDFALENGYVNTDYFITTESDAYPTKDGWLDYYDELIDAGWHACGSMLHQSGGQMLHPAGAYYKTSDWKEAMEYWRNVPYSYFPNAAMKEGFPCHLMVHNDILFDFMLKPKEFVELHESYGAGDMDALADKKEWYEPVTKVFHNGMGCLQESIKTFMHRDVHIGAKDAIINGHCDKLIYRIGMEPGQSFGYWLLAMGKPVGAIPTEVVWMGNRVGQQQAYTLMENGLRHEWGMSAYYKCEAADLQDVIKAKEDRIEELYLSLPEELKI